MERSWPPRGRCRQDPLGGLIHEYHGRPIVAAGSPALTVPNVRREASAVVTMTPSRRPLRGSRSRGRFGSVRPIRVGVVETRPCGPGSACQAGCLHLLRITPDHSWNRPRYRLSKAPGRHRQPYVCRGRARGGSIDAKNRGVRRCWGILGPDVVRRGRRGRQPRPAGNLVVVQPQPDDSRRHDDFDHRYRQSQLHGAHRGWVHGLIPIRARTDNEDPSCGMQRRSVDHWRNDLADQRQDPEQRVALPHHGHSQAHGRGRLRCHDEHRQLY